MIKVTYKKKKYIRAGSKANKKTYFFFQKI